MGLQGTWVGEFCGSQCVPTALVFSGDGVRPVVSLFAKLDGGWAFVLSEQGVHADGGVSVAFADGGATLAFSGVVSGANYVGVVDMRASGGAVTKGTFSYARQ